MLKQQVLREIPFQNIDVVEIPLIQLQQRNIYSQEASTKKKNKYQIILNRHSYKLETTHTEPSKVKSVRFKDEIEIIDQDILINPKLKIVEYEEEEKPPVPPTLLPVSKLNFPINLDKIRQQIDQDIQAMQKPLKNLLIHPEIPKRFQSVSRQERDKKINRLNNIYDPLNTNYSFVPISARAQSTQQNIINANNSYQQIQDYNEQYSYRSFYKQSINTTSFNNNSLMNRPKTNQRMSQENCFNNYINSSTTPIEQLMNQSGKNYNKKNFSFSENSSNYKNFAPSLSNTPTKIYQQNRNEQFEQENQDNFPLIHKSINFQKSTTPFSNAPATTKNTQQSMSSAVNLKEEDQEQLGEMLFQLKNVITHKKQQNNKRNKSRSPRRLNRLSIELNNPINKEIKQPAKNPLSNLRQNNQVNEVKPNKVIPEQIKNQLFKKIFQQRFQKQNEE